MRHLHLGKTDNWKETHGNKGGKEMGSAYARLEEPVSTFFLRGKVRKDSAVKEKRFVSGQFVMEESGTTVKHADLLLARLLPRKGGGQPGRKRRRSISRTTPC